MLKDFDIVKEAQGVDKVYIHNSTALVTDRALEIRLHWAGKGTTTSPKIGIYGPLISAIDIESRKFMPIISEFFIHFNVAWSRLMSNEVDSNE